MNVHQNIITQATIVFPYVFWGLLGLLLIVAPLLMWAYDRVERFRLARRKQALESGQRDPSSREAAAVTRALYAEHRASGRTPSR